MMKRRREKGEEDGSTEAGGKGERWMKMKEERESRKEGRRKYEGKETGQINT